MCYCNRVNCKGTDCKRTILEGANNIRTKKLQSHSDSRMDRTTTSTVVPRDDAITSVPVPPDTSSSHVPCGMDIDQQIHSLQIRLKGTETLSVLLSEAREQIAQLSAALRDREGTIVLLQNRLAQNGLSTSLSLGSTELIVPGASRELVQGLIRENARLKQSLKGAPMEEELRRRFAEQQNSIKILEDELTERRESLKKLEDAMTSSEDDKDKMIVSLRARLQELEKSSQTQDVLCKSLTEESETLRTRLQATAEMCNELATKLEAEKACRKKGDPSEDLERELRQMSVSEDKRYKQERRRAQEEIARLQGQVKELVDMNTRWQLYNDQREQYVQQLREKQLQLENRQVTPSAPVQTGLTEEQQRRIDQTILNAKRETEKTKEEAMRLHDDLTVARNIAFELQAQVEQLQMEKDHSRREIAELRRQGAHVPGDAQETIQMLQQQVQVCTEDFQAERQDRESLQTRLEELLAAQERDREVITMLRAQVRQLQSTGYRAPFPRPCQTEYRRNQPVEQSMLIARRGHNYGHHGYDVIDGMQDDDDLATDGVGSDEESVERKEHMLYRPRCKREYSKDKHDQLLEHIDVCCS
uniref:ABIN n=1 Tax=Branchiostoma belcheri tsingtauense TaxID=155462 RepID=A8WEM3_BRABE|nr:ABIN [Branchiostoma belcheri tsingtauense]AGQ17406.1 TNFAIP3 interacting protein 2 [Branchiostoma belcheri tsingtauense]